MARTISNGDDIIDSRDVIARIAELADERQDLDENDLDAWDEEHGDELSTLRAFADEGESLDDWHHGVALIRESYFETYAEEFADDIGAIDRKATWPLNHIDWKAAAEDLQQDYTSIEFDGVTYYGR